MGRLNSASRFLKNMWIFIPEIVVTGKGNYTNSIAEGTYDVVRRTADAIDLTKAKIVAGDKVNGKDLKVGKVCCLLS